MSDALVEEQTSVTTIYNKSVSSLCGETGTDVGTDSESYQNEFTDHGDEVEYVEPILDGTSLSCAGRELTTISVELGEKFGEKTLTLDLSFNLLEDVENLEKFPNLDSLILDNNYLDDSLNFPVLNNLKTLSLNNNKISNLEDILDQFKNCFPSLTFLSLLKNPACPNHLVGGNEEEYKRYRHQVIYALPELKFLDSTQITVHEKTEAKRVGPYLKVARPQAKKEPKKETKEETEEEEYPPLPANLAQHGEHKGTFGVSTYVYYGKHSEGNRFIRNLDL